VATFHVQHDNRVFASLIQVLLQPRQQDFVKALPRDAPLCELGMGKVLGGDAVAGTFTP
jgi:hypothetical protein